MNLSEEREKSFAGPRTRDVISSQAGQAALEYILVLVVVVAVALGVVYQFNDSFKSFLNGYFGDYLACLIETGELPSLGGDGGVTEGECNAGFNEFNLANGRTLIEGGSNESPGGESRSRSGGGRPASYTRSGSSLNGESGSNNFLRNRPAKQTLTPKNNSTGNRSVGNTTVGDSGTTIIRRRRGRREANIIDSKFIARNAKGKKEKVRKFKRPAKEKKEALLRSKKVKLEDNIIKDPTPKKADVSLPLTFGAVLKWLVIIAILIAILVFVGGQAVQIKKSWQKAD